MLLFTSCSGVCTFQCSWCKRKQGARRNKKRLARKEIRCVQLLKSRKPKGQRNGTLPRTFGESGV